MYVLNVRYDRGTEYDVIGQVKKGDIVNLQLDKYRRI